MLVKLNSLISAGKDRKRRGRGGSRGGTSGRGGQGQGSRTGDNPGFLYEGGQMPLSRRLPKRGFNNKQFKKQFEIVNLDQLELAFKDGDEVNPVSLIERGLIKGVQGSYIKILGNGSVTKKLRVAVHAISKHAEDALKSKGGEITILQ
jgi:large subunit ribosomal protein L15